MSISCGTKKLHKRPVVFNSSDEDDSPKKSNLCLKNVVCTLFEDPKQQTAKPKKNVFCKKNLLKEVCKPARSTTASLDFGPQKVASSNLKCNKTGMTMTDNEADKISNDLINASFTKASPSKSSLPDCDLKYVMSPKLNCSSNVGNPSGKPNFIKTKINESKLITDTITPEHPNSKSNSFHSCASSHRKITPITWSSDEEDDVFLNSGIKSNECFPSIKTSHCLATEQETLPNQPKVLFEQQQEKPTKMEHFYNTDKLSNRSNSDSCMTEDIKLTSSDLKTPTKTIISYRVCASSSKKLPILVLSSDEEEEFSSHEMEKENELLPPNFLGNEKVSLFLRSLSSSVKESDSAPEAFKYKRNFHNLKFELTRKLYSIFNKSIFGDKLPQDMKLEWSDRLLKTAGICRYYPNVYAEIYLSTKVLDSAERLRDTLVHEMCHAAVFLINGLNCGHGPIWQLYALRCSMAFPELKVPQRCHNYEIHYKYNYHCQKCSKVVGRHSNSLDISKYHCRCGGRFRLTKNHVKF